MRGLPDLNYITSRMIIGGDIASVGKMKQLVRVGVTHIVDVTLSIEPCRDDVIIDAIWGDRAYTSSPFPRPVYLHVPTDDDHKPKPVEWFGRIVPFVLHALGYPRVRVYGHCAAGISRSAVLWYAVLRALGFCAVEAEGMLVRARPVVSLCEAYRESAELALVELGYV